MPALIVLILFPQPGPKPAVRLARMLAQILRRRRWRRCGLRRFLKLRALVVSRLCGLHRHRDVIVIPRCGLRRGRWCGGCRRCRLDREPWMIGIRDRRNRAVCIEHRATSKYGSCHLVYSSSQPGLGRAATHDNRRLNNAKRRCLARARDSASEVRHIPSGRQDRRRYGKLSTPIIQVCSRFFYTLFRLCLLFHVVLLCYTSPCLWSRWCPLPQTVFVPFQGSSTTQRRWLREAVSLVKRCTHSKNLSSVLELLDVALGAPNGGALNRVRGPADRDPPQEPEPATSRDGPWNPPRSRGGGCQVLPHHIKVKAALRHRGTPVLASTMATAPGTNAVAASRLPSADRHTQNRRD